MKPKTMMIPRAMSFDVVKTSCTFVAAFTLMQLTNVNKAVREKHRVEQQNMQKKWTYMRNDSHSNTITG